MKVKITERDLKLFRYLFENKIATRDQIARDIFKNIKKQTVNIRLLKLAKNKYVESYPIVLNKKTIYSYELNQKGLQVLKKDYRYTITSKRYKSDSIKHDLTLVDLRFAFKKMELITKYYTESMLQSCAEFEYLTVLQQFVAIKCDAVIKVETIKKDYYFAIEYEATRKAKERYYKKLTEYHLNHMIPAVLFITREKGVMKLIKNIEIDVCGKDFKKIVYFSLLEDVLNAKEEMQFFNVENKLLRLD